MFFSILTNKPLLTENIFTIQQVKNFAEKNKLQNQKKYSHTYLLEFTTISSIYT